MCSFFLRLSPKPAWLTYNRLVIRVADACPRFPLRCKGRRIQFIPYQNSFPHQTGPQSTWKGLQADSKRHPSAPRKIFWQLIFYRIDSLFQTSMLPMLHLWPLFCKTIIDLEKHKYPYSIPFTLNIGQYSFISSTHPLQSGNCFHAASQYLSVQLCHFSISTICRDVSDRGRMKKVQPQYICRNSG